MSKVFKWLGIIIGIAFALIVLGISYVYIATGARMNKVYTVQIETVDVPAELPVSDRGYPQVLLSACRDCHGQNFAGQVMEDDPLVGYLAAPNLTRGKGSAVADFTTEDWVRVLRHGIDEDGTSLVVMPSDSFSYLSDADLGYVIAYLQNVPPVDHELPKVRLGPMGRFFLLVGEPFLVAELIDHDAPRQSEPEPGITLEHGRYLTYLCINCHGNDYAGGQQPGAGLNLTPGGDLASWTEADFINAMRAGNRPDGRQLDQEMMPVRIVGQFNDEELKAIWLFLQSLPPIETKPDSET